MKIGVLTGGGDAPGLNGVIESLCRTLFRQNVEVLGIEDGFEGIFSGRSTKLTPELVEGIHSEAGTLLGASNKSPLSGREGEFLKKIKEFGMNGLVAIGGDGTFAALSLVRSGLNLIGVPKTIDNDLPGTDVTFGFDTACTVIGEAVSALRYTAEAHRRVMVIEAMGRTAGWIALGGGLAGYADAILIPERPLDRERLREFILNRKKNKRGLVVVVAEGLSSAESLARWIETECAWDARHVVPGHLQRARSPTVTDRLLTMAMGTEAARMVLETAWNQGVVFRGGRVTRASITEMMGSPRLVSPTHRWVQIAESTGLFI